MTRELDVRRAAVGGAFASAVVGLFALATSGPVGPVPLVVLAAALVLAGVTLRSRTRLVRPQRFLTGLTTFAVAAIVVPAHTALSGSWLFGAVDLLVILQANRLWSLRKDAAAVGQVLIIGILMLAAAAVLTIRLEFLLAVFLFCLAGTWTGVFRSLLDPDATGPEARVPWRVGAVALAAGVGVFALTIVLFGVLPRLQFQTFSGGVLLTESVSGFSDEVRLGDLGGAKLDHRPVMRVMLEGRPVAPPDFYWRGMALDRYDSEKKLWTISEQDETRIGPRRGFSLDARKAGMATFRIATPEPSEPVRQTIMLEPLDVSVLFALPGLKSVEADLPLVTVNRTDSIKFRAREFGRMRYEADSWPPKIDADALLATRAAVPEEDRERYLQVPEHLREPLAKLARELAGEGPDFRRVRRLEVALQQWEYDLQPRRGDNPDPVLDFLETRVGWCEHYSSGMVLLLRSIGIPARMANGFHGGEKNDLGGFWLVRRSDAHSWVEVPFEGHGWMTFDPTPGGGGANRERGALDGLRKGWDALRLIWSQRIVEYNLIDQFTLLRSTIQRGEAFGDRISSAIAGLSPARVARPGLAGLALIALGLVSRRVWKLGRTPRRDPRAVASAEAEAWWKRVESFLRRSGFVRAAGETARDLARRAGRREWADLYYIARFGVRPLSEEEQRAIDSILGEIGWRRSPRGPGGRTPTTS